MWSWFDSVTSIDNGTLPLMRDTLPLGKPLITLHPPEISHMPEEVNASASVVCQEAEQVVQTLAYVIKESLSPKDGNADPNCRPSWKGKPQSISNLYIEPIKYLK
jgi:hypothetical protein